MEHKRRLFAFREEESSLARRMDSRSSPAADLLNKDPQTHPQELALATGPSVSWVKKWRKRLREGDPHDQELLCSCSRAYHAPNFRWDLRVETCIVEIRLSPSEHEGTRSRSPSPARVSAA